MDLAGGDDVDPHPLLPHDAVDLPEAGGFPGVEGAGPGREGRLHLPQKETAVFPDPGFVVQIERGPVPVGERGNALSRKGEVASV